jgi:hypothetical protein
MSNATALHAGLQILASLLNSFHRRLHLALRLRRAEPVALAEVRAFPGWLAVVQDSAWYVAGQAATGGAGATAVNNHGTTVNT